MGYNFKVLTLLLDIALCVGTVVGQCGSIPVITNSENNRAGNPAYPEGSTVDYSCLASYYPQGNNRYICTNGNWAGGPFSCRIIECSALEAPMHGRMIGDHYEVGSVMRFQCDAGYDLVGLSALLCESDSNWNPPNVPECQIKNCPATPSIQHGNVFAKHTVDGRNNVYGAILGVQCDDNYMKSGPARIYCNENGEWTEKSKCEPVTCPPYPGLDATCVLKSKLQVANTLLLLYCTDNATFVYDPNKDGTAFCDNGSWDDPTMRCYCNCVVKANTDLVHIENLDANGFLKHGDILDWSCKHGATKAPTAPLTCNDGLVGIPVCTPAPTTVTTKAPTTATTESKNTTGKGSTDKNVTEPFGNDDSTILIVVVVVLAVGTIAGGTIAAVVIYRYIIKKKGQNSNGSASLPAQNKNSDTVHYTNEKGGEDTVNDGEKSLLGQKDCLETETSHDEKVPLK